MVTAVRSQLCRRAQFDAVTLQLKLYAATPAAAESSAGWIPLLANFDGSFSLEKLLLARSVGLRKAALRFGWPVFNTPARMMVEEQAHEFRVMPQATLKEALPLTLTFDVHDDGTNQTFHGTGKIRVQSWAAEQQGPANTSAGVEGSLEGHRVEL